MFFQYLLMFFVDDPEELQITQETHYLFTNQHVEFIVDSEYAGLFLSTFYLFSFYAREWIGTFIKFYLPFTSFDYFHPFGHVK